MEILTLIIGIIGIFILFIPKQKLWKIGDKIKDNIGDTFREYE